MKNSKVILENHQFLSSLINEGKFENNFISVDDFFSANPDFTSGLSDEDLKTLREILSKPISDEIDYSSLS